MAKIDVILCAYNSENTLFECVDSILSQSFSDFNLFIFNDCSTDDTALIADKFHDKRVKILNSKKNVGTYAGKNFILKNFVSSKYVALHDADDISYPDRFKIQFEFMEKNEDVACTGSSIREFWTDIEPHTDCSTLGSNERVNFYPPTLSRSSLLNIADTLSHSGNYDDFLKLKLCMNGSVMLRSSVLKKYGGWDGMTRIAADSDLFIRILSHHRIVNLEDTLYSRRFHKDSLTASKHTGINSKIRKMYNQSRRFIFERSSRGIRQIEKMICPELEMVEVKCVEY